MGYVHLDIKPENFVLDDNNNLVLIDFGTCKQIVKTNSLSNIKTKIGSEGYLSPEAAINYYNDKTDLWSVGVILYILLTNEKLYSNVNQYLFLGHSFSNLPIFSQKLIESLLDPVPSKRLNIDLYLNYIDRVYYKKC